MNQLLALGTALTLGFAHALEIDHMVAVTAFVSHRPAVLSALGFGLRWGLGHSVAVLIAGALLLATGIRWTPGVSRVLEGAVGVALVAVGLWALRATRNIHLHPPDEHGDHAHLHLHKDPGGGHAHPHGAGAPRPVHHHPRGVSLVGLIHGLAGTSAAVALVPVTLAPGWGLGQAYLAVFGVGVTAGMMVFAAVAAAGMRRAADRSVRWGKRVAGLAGLSSVATGVWWLARVLFSR